MGELEMDLPSALHSNKGNVSDTFSKVAWLNKTTSCRTFTAGSLIPLASFAGSALCDIYNNIRVARS
jgi:hypothetical protein